ncbi:MAG: DUF5684 domain-containing protein [Pirellulales bacterium]
MAILDSLLLIGQRNDDAAAALAGLFVMMMILAVVTLPLSIFIIATWWKVYTKAGKPGWASLIPIYGTIVFLEIVGRPIWWVVLTLIPCVNFVVIIILFIDLAKSFGKDVAFAVGMILLGIVFLPILAFGNSRYIGPAALQN